MPAGTVPVKLFLSARPAASILGVVVLLGALAAWFGTVKTPLPQAAGQDSAIIPLWRLLVMGAAVLPVIGLASPLAGLELAATRRLRSMQRFYLAGSGVGSAVIFLGISALAMQPAVVAIMARGWIAWFGLALVAGAVLGWRLAWTLPSVIAVVLWYWGFGGNDQYRWLEFSARPYDDVPSLVLSATLLAVGLAAYAVTPWRRRRLMFWR
ncbi:hypothetical protein O7632_15645 [Solwaraspora sp. WMMD406]|uniref:hypothetical protein n=1 Tax=Solwaraspora sp. WMMD406 TaxID=3016095 RepID=UPI002415F9FF|nr:hypothetical protein [Solwaraspora sp. WMMD406]MDG4765519.1 hypothetical protein [Solwaraspora sp. WMMD406]